MKRQIVIIGLGRFGTSLATTLSSIGHDVLAIDKEEKYVQNIASQVTHAIMADATNEAVLKELGVGNFDIAVVAIGSDLSSSVLTTILLKNLGVRYIIARANDKPHGSILEKIGSDNVVYPEREMGTRIAHGVALIGILDYLPVVPGYGIIKLATQSHIVGQSLASIGVGPKGRLNIAALLLQRKNEVVVNPSHNEAIKQDDTLILAGSDENLERLLLNIQRRKNGE